MSTQHTSRSILPASLMHKCISGRLCSAATLAVLLGFINSAAALEPVGLMNGFDRARLQIDVASPEPGDPESGDPESADSEPIEVSIYVAKTRQQHTQGLMNVRSMKSHEGMLFIYSRPALITMWMKNTYIPLDMIFADSQGRIVNIHAGARPHDTTVISSVEKATLVLELNAGSIQRFGIAIGDRISLLPD